MGGLGGCFAQSRLNFGEGHQGELYDAYGIDADEERIRYYRALWQPES